MLRRCILLFKVPCDHTLLLLLLQTADFRVPPKKERLIAGYVQSAVRDLSRSCFKLRSYPPSLHLIAGKEEFLFLPFPDRRLWGCYTFAFLRKKERLIAG